MNEILEQAQFGADGLIPAVVQDASTREVLTVAYMNEEALRLTIERGETYFWSRSRQAALAQGRNLRKLPESRAHVSLDCDDDAVLVEVEPPGPACHTGSYSCFGVEPDFEGILRELYALIESRKEAAAGRKLHDLSFQQRPRQDLKKVGEEATETVIAAKNDDPNGWYRKPRICFIT